MTYANNAFIDELFARERSKQRCLVVTDHSLIRRLEYRRLKGSIVKLSKGIYAQEPYWSELSKTQQASCYIRALSNLHPNWIFCCYSAAVMFDLAVSNSLLNNVHILGKRDQSYALRHIVYHDERSTLNLANNPINKTPSSEKDVSSYGYPTLSKDLSCALLPGDITRVKDVPCTSIIDTLFDCARLAPFPQGLAIVDSALRLGLIGQEELNRNFECMRAGKKGVRRARKVAKYASPLAESGGESIARATMIECGFDVPELQVVIPNPLHPQKQYRVDFLWHTPQGVVIGELDGREKYLNAEMTGGKPLEEILIEERLRDSRLGINGARIMRFSYRDILDRAFFSHLLDAYGVPRAKSQCKC